MATAMACVCADVDVCKATTPDTYGKRGEKAELTARMLAKINGSGTRDDAGEEDKRDGDKHERHGGLPPAMAEIPSDRKRPSEIGVVEQRAITTGKRGKRGAILPGRQWSARRRRGRSNGAGNFDFLAGVGEETASLCLI
jgi:hypothetical protein